MNECFGVWNSIEEIDYNALPNQFVLKPTNGSGDIVICKNKSYFNWEEAKRTLTKYSKTDIKTNLFRDYYANNLMRFISEMYRGKLCEFELDPSGQGINYKNFAEMIYLYYISKDCSPQDKIRLSSKMIERVRQSRFKQGKIDTEKAGGTAFYRNLFSEDILSLPESKFEAFLCEN